jgi:hypothetical protein
MVAGACHRENLRDALLTYKGLLRTIKAAMAERIMVWI